MTRDDRPQLQAIAAGKAVDRGPHTLDVEKDVEPHEKAFGAWLTFVLSGGGRERLAAPTQILTPLP